MGIHYQHSDENMWVSLWKSARWCQFVDGNNGVLMYRNTNGFGVDPKSKPIEDQPHYRLIYRSNLHYIIILY